MNLLCGAPVREDVPHDAVVAEAREEIQGAIQVSNRATIKQSVTVLISVIYVTTAIEPRLYSTRVGVLGRVADLYWEDHYQAFCDYAARRAYKLPMSKTEDKISGGYTRRGSRQCLRGAYGRGGKA